MPSKRTGFRSDKQPGKWGSTVLILRKFTKMLVLSATFISVFFISSHAADLKAGIVNVQTYLNFRSSPSSTSESVEHLKNGKVLLVESADNGWHKAYLDGKEGYVSADYITLSSHADADFGDGIITGSVVNLRQSAGTEYPVLSKLSANDKVNITGIDGQWLKVSGASSSGYVYNQYITPFVSDNTANTSSTGAQKLISYAKGFLGVPYVRGGSSAKGFDCSGFTQYVFKNFGVSLSRTASSQVKNCKSVSRSALTSGDLVFFRSPSSSSVAHVGIYIGGGSFIHASSPGDVVKIDTLNSGYYDKYYVCAGRVSLNIK